MAVRREMGEVSSGLTRESLCLLRTNTGLRTKGSLYDGDACNVVLFVVG